MEAIRTAYAKIGRASFTKNILIFAESVLMKPVVKVLLKCVIWFAISFRWYAFPSFRTQISRPLAELIIMKSSVAKHYGCKRTGHGGPIAKDAVKVNQDFSCVRNMN